MHQRAELNLPSLNKRELNLPSLNKWVFQRKLDNLNLVGIFHTKVDDLNSLKIIFLKINFENEF